jgi:sporulation protein YlmC with PRC-barrel domain
MNLVRDILDKQVLDRNGRPMGRVDGLVIELGGDGPPRVVAVQMGAVVLAYRLGPRIGAMIARVAERLGGREHRDAFRIPWTAVTDVGRDLEVSVDVTETPLRDWQNWLNRHIIKHIPGG